MPTETSRFVIITQPRSGSYHFKSLLDSAEDIVCQGEIFKKGAVEIDCCLIAKLGLNKDDMTERDQAPFAFVNRLRNLCSADKIFGFKAFWPHLEPHKPLINKIILNPEWKKIFLVRNPLQTYASLLRAKKTQVWVQKEGKPGQNLGHQEHVTVHFDPPSFEKHWANYQRVINKNHKLMASQASSCLEVGYGEMACPARLDSVLAFLGSTADSRQLTSEYQKQYRGTLLEGFDNPEKLLDYLNQQGLLALTTTERDIFA